MLLVQSIYEYNIHSGLDEQITLVTHYPELATRQRYASKVFLCRNMQQRRIFPSAQL